MYVLDYVRIYYMVYSCITNIYKWYERIVCCDNMRSSGIFQSMKGRYNPRICDLWVFFRAWRIKGNIFCISMKGRYNPIIYDLWVFFRFIMQREIYFSRRQQEIQTFLHHVIVKCPIFGYFSVHHEERNIFLLIDYIKTLCVLFGPMRKIKY